MEKRSLTTAERKLMGILWDAGKALTSGEMLRLAGDGAWSENHIFKLLRGLEKDGFLRVCGVERAGTRYTRQFIPCVSKEDYVSGILEMERLAPAELTRIALAFVKKSALEKSADDREKLIAELKEMIEQYRNEEEGE